jgi:hypothetical protein
VDSWAGGQVDSWTGEQVDRWTGGQVDRWTVGKVDAHLLIKYIEGQEADCVVVLERS